VGGGEGGAAREERDVCLRLHLSVHLSRYHDGYLLLTNDLLLTYPRYRGMATRQLTSRPRWWRGSGRGRSAPCLARATASCARRGT
jgi:hypothetical protein